MSAAVDEFEPTEQQAEFAEVVRNCIAEGELMVAEWLEAFQAASEFWITMEEWRAWERSERFMAWFRAEFPILGAMTTTDVMMLDGLYWRGIAKGLQNDSPDAFKLYNRHILAREEVDPEADQELMEAIEKAQRDNGWGDVPDDVDEPVPDAVFKEGVTTR